VKELLSPKQVARAIGVSESSLKRWCDQGLIQAVRTAGGHRKLPLCDVIQFLREQQHKVVCPEALGLPVRSPHSEIGLDRGRDSFTDALIEGNESLARQIVFDLYLAKHPICVICDRVICPAFQEIGRRWECQSLDVYRERRGCEITHKILYELRRKQPDPDPTRKACGGSLEGDSYTLPTTMADLVVRNAGWDTSSLGSGIPVESMVQAIRETKPELFWLCVSHIGDVERFVHDFKNLSEATHTVGVAFAIGGRALTADLLTRIKFCCYCDSMQQLESFACLVRQNQK
jgi:excisionase family DNA binding protein